MKRKISCEEFRKALHDEDNIKIMKSAIRKSPVAKNLTEDEQESCKLIALWNSLQNWDNNPEIKFTTFLYKNVTWQCLLQRQINNKFYKRHITISNDNEFSNRNFHNYLQANDLEEMMSFCLQKLPEKTVKILRQRYYENMTLKEIGKQNGYSHETARRNVNLAVKQIKQLYSQYGEFGV